MSIRSHRAGGRPAARLVRLAALALALPALTGAALGNSAAERPSRSVQELDCTDPDPCGYVWPGASQEAFELDRVEEVVVESHDEVALHGWLAFPTLDVGMRAPVALHSSPYLGVCSRGARGCAPNPWSPSFWSDDPHPGAIRAWGVPPIELIRRGYVTAFFEVRGTGGSEGCIDWYGEDETRDQKVLVDWLARQSWSNGRVGMGGNSYAGTTPWQAAVQAPHGLKTIVTAGIVTDFYSFFHTPQGVQHAEYPRDVTEIETSTAWLPHAGGVGSVGLELVRIAERAAVEECPAFAPGREATEGAFLSERDTEFWEPRRYQDRLDQVRASVLMAPGLQDVTGHAFQDMLVWEALQGPASQPRQSRSGAGASSTPAVWQISGQWGHGPPFATTPALTPDWIEDNWSDNLFDWLGYWLQGVGDRPPHRVDYQDTAGAWHTSSAWPPSEAREEVLHLDGRALSTSTSGDDRRFIAAPTVLGMREHTRHAAWPGSPSCRQEHAPESSEPPDAVAYVSEPFAIDSLLAGNPFVYLELSSDQPGGLVEVALLHWPAGASCDDVAIGTVVARGAADLGHHRGSYDHQPFPVGEPTPVRVDLFNNAVRFGAGDRLALVVSGPEESGGGLGVSPYTPQVTVHGGASHVVLPFVSGGLGGSEPDMVYPPNPAAPGVDRS